MKNKILAMLLSFTLIFTTTGFSFASDEVAPTPKSEKQTEQAVKEEVKTPAVKEVKVEKEEVVVKEEAKPEVKPEATKEELPKEVVTNKVEIDKKPISEIGPPEAAVTDTYSVTYNVYYRYPSGNGWKNTTKTFNFSQNGTSSSWKGIDYTYKQMVNNGVDKPFVYEGVKYTFNGKWEDENGNSYDRDSRLTGKEYSTDTVVNIYAQYDTKNMCKFTFVLIDDVSTGSGSWDEEPGASTTFSHTFTNPLDKTPVEGYEFLYWENVNDSKEKYEADETYTCDLTKLKEDTTVEFVAVYTQIYTLKINDAEKVYGEEDPKFTAEWDGPFKIQWKYSREPGENVGDYKITAKITGMNEVVVEKASNYKIVIEDGNLRITPREITIAAVYKLKMLKDVTDDEEFDATVTGVLPQDEEWFEEEVYWDVDCDYEEAVGDYPIIVEAEWDPDIYIIDDPIFPWPGEFEEWPQEMKKVEDVPMIAAKSVGLKKNSTIVAGNYTIKTVDNVFQIRDNVTLPVDPDNPVVDPTDNDSTVNKASGIVKTGDADACWALLNLLLMITSCLLTFLVVLSRVLKRDEEEYVNESKSFFNNWFESILSGVVAVFTAIVFFITENMNTLMVWTDRWTVMMIILFVLQLAVVAYVKFRDKIFEEDN